MSLSNESRSLIERLRPVIESTSAQDLTRHIESEEYSSFRDETLALAHEGSFRAFFAPFDWINEAADVVIVGVTPGRQQALEALLAMHAAFRSGHSIDEAARQAKSAASFKGGMRTLGARLMDHFNLHKIFGLNSSIDLFGKAAARAHYTSVLRYPVLKDFKNYSGDKKIAVRNFMHRMIDSCFAPELASLPNAWIVPFGPTAHLALESLASRGLISSERILGGILHPSGTQWNRYNVQLDLVSREKAVDVSGGQEVLRRSDALRAKVKSILSAGVS
jgi:hypothetical protein